MKFKEKIGNHLFIMERTWSLTKMRMLTETSIQFKNKTIMCPREKLYYKDVEPISLEKSFNHYWNQLHFNPLFSLFSTVGMITESLKHCELVNALILEQNSSDNIFDRIQMIYKNDEDQYILIEIEDDKTLSYALSKDGKVFKTKIQINLFELLVFIFREF